MLFRPPAVPFVPASGLAVSGTDVSLSWSTQAVGWTLQSASALAPATAWSPVVHAVSISGGAFQMTLPRDGTRQFFRLIQP